MTNQPFDWTAVYSPVTAFRYIRDCIMSAHIRPGSEFVNALNHFRPARYFRESLVSQWQWMMFDLVWLVSVLSWMCDNEIRRLMFQFHSISISPHVAYRISCAPFIFRRPTNENRPKFPARLLRLSLSRNTGFVRHFISPLSALAFHYHFVSWKQKS